MITISIVSPQKSMDVIDRAISHHDFGCIFRKYVYDQLEEIKDLRTVWPHEAIDFTPWLSQEDNIALLADAVGIDITVDETESSVGDFNVDIFASETGTERKIIERRNGRNCRSGIMCTNNSETSIANS